jgi:hypothetical protein
MGFRCCPSSIPEEGAAVTALASRRAFVSPSLCYSHDEVDCGDGRVDFSEGVAGRNAVMICGTLQELLPPSEKGGTKKR